MAPELAQQPTVVLIPAGDTEWDEQDRMAGAADLPLSEEGLRQVQEMAGQIADEQIKLLCVSANQAAQQTAAVLGEELDIDVKTVKGLEAVDVGLWEGLTTEQLRQRYTRVYKQWSEHPTSIRPPQGENLQEAADRLVAAIVREARKSKVQPVGVVLGRLTLEVARCRLEGSDIDDIWKNMEDTICWRSYGLSRELLSTSKRD